MTTNPSRSILSECLGIQTPEEEALRAEFDAWWKARPKRSGFITAEDVWQACRKGVAIERAAHTRVMEANGDSRQGISAS